jgi:uncharacterized membrane protein YfcA
MLNRMVLTILLGSLSGILGGASGLGGSFIILPGLIMLGITPDFQTAVGTTLLSLLPPISLLGVIEYYKRKKVDTLVGIILFITYFIFAYYGSIINKMYSDKTLKFYTGILFLIISFYFLWESIKKV